MKGSIFEGVCTALITPFNDKNQIDFDACRKLVSYQLENQIDAILILGSTGESFAISDEERKKYVAFVRGLIPNSCKLIVGAGSNTPNRTIALIEELNDLGVDAVLVQTPYFNRCTQNGIYQHFKTVCDNVGMPIIVYNIPTRSGVNIQPSTMKQLCGLKNIAGLKEANGEINHILDMFHTIGDDIAIYCGNDNLNYVFLMLGAKGTISVTSNVFPKNVENMWKNRKKSLEIHNKLFNFNNLMFCEPNPIPVKYALSKLGWIENNLRLPLTPLEEMHKNVIDKEIDRLGEIL